MKGGLETIATPPNVINVDNNINTPPNGSPKNKLAKTLTNTGYELHITEESPNGIYFKE